MSGTTFSKLPVMIVALVIGLILTFSAIMPLVSDYSDAKTFKNEGYYYMDNPTESVTIALDNGSLTVNGQSVNPGDNSTYPDGVSILITENSILRYYGSELRSRGGLIGYHTISACELTFNEGTVTGTYTESDNVTTVSTTYTDLTIISPNKTSKVMCKPVTQYALIDSEISGAGVIATPNQTTKYWVAEFTGSIEDGLDVKLYGQSTGVEPSTTHAENVKINYTEDDSYIGLYKITSITFDVVGEDTSPDSITFTIYLSPSEVTADPDNPVAYKNLVKVIPLFALILLVAGAATLVYFKNKD